MLLHFGCINPNWTNKANLSPRKQCELAPLHRVPSEAYIWPTNPPPHWLSTVKSSWLVFKTNRKLADTNLTTFPRVSFCFQLNLVLPRSARLITPSNNKLQPSSAAFDETAPQCLRLSPEQSGGCCCSIAGARASSSSTADGRTRLQKQLAPIASAAWPSAVIQF